MTTTVLFSRFLHDRTSLLLNKTQDHFKLSKKTFKILNYDTVRLQNNFRFLLNSIDTSLASDNDDVFKSLDIVLYLI
jgi:hypothetical protein